MIITPEIKNFFKWFLAAGFLLVLALLVAGHENSLPNIPTSEIQTNNFEINKIQYVKIGGVTLKVDLALKPAEQEQGLSGRKELKNDEGMLFVFEQPDKYSFWMKDMNFSIDIIWLAPSEGGDSGDLNVIYIKKNALPESYPETFTPPEKAKYVLETVSSFSEKNNLKVGDRVSIY